MDARHRRERRLPRPGLPPGTLLTDSTAGATTLRAFGFSPESFEEVTITDPSLLRALRDRWPVVWVDVAGLRDAALLGQVAEIFQLHPLAMEDVVDTSQRAKAEPYGEITFVVAPMPRLNEPEFCTEQLSLFVGPGWVVTFQEALPGDCLDGIRDRIRLKRGRVRTQPAAYLAYALLDAVIDAYFPIVERLGDALDDLERDVLDGPRHTHVARMRRLKRELTHLRRAIWPMRDAVTTMMTLDLAFPAEVRFYLRDAHDHVVRLMDIIEMDRSMASDLMEIHLNAVSARLGEVNKFLTVIATIFLPLSWIAGIYGMNFEFMPELGWKYGYVFALGLMILCAASFLWYFKRKGWLEPSPFGRVRRPDAPRGAPVTATGDAPDDPEHPPGAERRIHRPR